MKFTGVVVGRSYTREELASRWGYRGTEAISRGVITPTDQPVIILFVTRRKRDDMTQYRDMVRGEHLYWDGEARHGSDNRITAVVLPPHGT